MSFQCEEKKKLFTNLTIVWFSDQIYKTIQPAGYDHEWLYEMWIIHCLMIDHELIVRSDNDYYQVYVSFCYSFLKEKKFFYSKTSNPTPRIETVPMGKNPGNPDSVYNAQ